MFKESFDVYMDREKWELLLEEIKCNPTLKEIAEIIKATMERTKDDKQYEGDR